MADDDLPPDEGLEGADAPIVADEPHNDEPQPISVDDLATGMGWTPQEKWRGDPDKWRPAADFLKRTVDVNRSLSTEVKTIKATLDTVARTSAQLTERALEQQREELLAKRQEAFDMGDGATFDKVDQDLKRLGNVTVQPVAPPEVSEFERRNASWFKKDDEATAWAINRAGELANQGIGTTRQLAIVEREAKGMFPEFFEEVVKPKAAPLSRPGNRGSAPQGKGFAALPEAAKNAAIDYEKRSKGSITREDYARTYFEELGQ